MTDVTAEGLPNARSVAGREPAAVARRIAQRRAAEWRFQAYGIAAILFGLFFVALLFGVIGSKGYTALLQTQLTLPVTFDKAVIDPNNNGSHDDLMAADYASLAAAALYKKLGIAPGDAAATALADGLISTGADVELRKVVLADPSVIGATRTVSLLAHGNVDALLKGSIDRAVPEDSRQIKDQQIAWVDKLRADGSLVKAFNWGLFTYGASSQPETAGLGVAVIGSLYMMLTVLLIAVPLGVASAAYMSEIAPLSVRRIGAFLIELLAAIPSVVYGFWGLFFLAPVIQELFTALGGPNTGGNGILSAGIILAIMILPYVTAISYDVCQAVPRSQREGSLALGATRWQTIWRVVLPFARPGILAASFLALGRALGETMAVTMLIGNKAEIQFSPFALGDSIASRIANQLNEADSREFRAALITLALVLFVVTAAFNISARLLLARLSRESRRKMTSPPPIEPAATPVESQDVVSRNSTHEGQPRGKSRAVLWNRVMTGVLGGSLLLTVVPSF